MELPGDTVEDYRGLPQRIPCHFMRDDMLSTFNGVRPSVTVVDDEPFIQDILSRAARSWKYDCQTACSAEQALELLQRQLTPVVVTDLRMPGLGGLWLVQQIRQRWPHVGIVVLTAAEDTFVAQQ